ncbi:MAG: alpha/beta fold hydrolase [Paracoccaceae bacterium]|nr:alpha/beta fold hydrolase [Paracoccaceae bacterium]
MHEPLILIPGLMCDARLFWHQLLYLGRHRPIMLILPIPGATVEDMSQAVLTAAPARFALCGLGLGGDVALDVIRRAADRVTRVVLLSTDPLAETPQAAAARESRIVAARSGRLAQAVAEEVPQGALAAGPARAEVLDLLAEMAQSLGAEVFVAQSRALQRRPDQQKTLRRALVPALILAGAQDTLVPLRRQEFVAELMPYGKFQVIDQAGHLAPLEQPEAVTEALEAFLKGPMMLR